METFIPIVKERYDDKPQFIVTNIAVASNVDNANSAEEFNNAFHWYKALWNTGVNKTIISQKVLDDLSIQPAGEGGFVSPTGVIKVPTYSVVLAFPNTKLFLKGIEVLSQDLTTTPFDIVVGMDIIAEGDFNVYKDSDGYHVTFEVQQ